MAIADELIAILGFDLRGEAAARRYNELLDAGTRKLNEMSLAAGRVAGYAGAALAAGVGLAGRSIINATAQFETFEATLTTIEGSSEAARASLDWIAEFAKTTPYDVAGVTDAFVRLKAYGIDPVANDSLAILGDTAASMGKPLMDAVEMFADASSMEFERLKEFGIRATQAGDEVTFAWTENGEELTRTMKKNGDEVRAFILENLGERFSGAMDRQSRTYMGMMSNLGDAWGDFQRRIGGAGFFENITSKLEGLLAIIARLDAEGRLDAWATAISNSLSRTADVLWAVGERIFNNAIFLADNWDALKGYVYGVGAALGFLIARAFPLVTAFAAITLAIDDLIAYMQGAPSIFGDIVKEIMRLTGLSENVSEALAGLGVAVSAALAAAFLFAPGRILGAFSRLMVFGLTGVGNVVIASVVLLGARLKVALIALRGIMITAAIGTTLIGPAFRLGFAAAGLAGAAAIAAMGPVLSAALTALSSVVSAGISAALFLLTNPIGWAILLAGAAAGLIAYFWDDFVAAFNALAGQATALFAQLKDWILAVDWVGLGSQIMTAIWDGMKAIGGAIRDWFVGLFELPDIQMPAWMSNPGASGTPMGNPMGDYDPYATGGTMSGGSRASIVDNRDQPTTNNVTVNQTVNQATDAPARAAEATASAVSGRMRSQNRAQLAQEPAF